MLAYFGSGRHELSASASLAYWFDLLYTAICLGKTEPTHASLVRSELIDDAVVVFVLSY
jgi:hypothetical protein